MGTQKLDYQRQFENADLSNLPKATQQVKVKKSIKVNGKTLIDNEARFNSGSQVSEPCAHSTSLLMATSWNKYANMPFFCSICSSQSVSRFSTDILIHWVIPVLLLLC